MNKKRGQTYVVEGAIDNFEDGDQLASQGTIEVAGTVQSDIILFTHSRDLGKRRRLVTLSKID